MLSIDPSFMWSASLGYSHHSLTLRVQEMMENSSVMDKAGSAI